MATIKSFQKEQFDTIKKFLDTINSRPNNKVMEGKNNSHTGSEDFTRTTSYEEATRLILNGWDELLPRIKEQFKVSVKNNANGEITKRRTYNHVVGYAPNVPNAILGLPQSKITSDRVAQKVKAISIAYAPDANGGESAETFIKAGIVVLNIVNQLELNGTRVRLMITPMDSIYDESFVSCMVCVKDFREQLDLKKVAFPIANPSFLRRFGFKWLETYPELKERGFRSGYGSTISDESSHKDDLVKGGVLTENDYFMSLGRIKELRYDIPKVMNDAGIQI